MDFKLTKKRFEGFDEAANRAQKGNTLEVIKFLAQFGPSEYRMTEKELLDFLDEIEEITGP